MYRNRSHSLAVGLFLFGAMALTTGCGSRGPKTHPVHGRIQCGGDPSALAGSHIEAMKQGETDVRASGEIQPDGTFTLQTMHQGVLQKGAVEGTYLVRILPNDDEPASRKRAASAVARRYLAFETSGLAFQVPSAEEVRLAVAPR